MDRFKDKTSQFNRRSSSRRSSGLSNGSIIDDEEEYDLAAAAVSDGFRPTHPTPTFLPTSHSQSTSQSPSQPQPFSSVSDTITREAHPSMANRPLSISKPLRAHDSLTLRNDGSHAGQILPSGPASSSTDAPQIRPQSPYRGPTGPSHPYQMYQQRTLSIATTSTAAPAHPYALYTQNIPNGDNTPEPHIPVGFAGVGDSYRRQIGPDGEESGGLIGPLGHTEELPPYTRYPDESSAEKTSVEANNNASTASSPQLAIPGAGGIGVATRNPEFSATEEDLDLTRSRPSMTSQHDVNTAAHTVAEKPEMNKWQRRGKKKLWGVVPYWAICLLTIGVILLGIVLGAVIGKVLSPHTRSANDYPVPTPTPTMVVGVNPIPTVPADLPPLTTGSFLLPQLIVNQAPRSCFNDTTQSQAWSCDMPYHVYAMNIRTNDAAVATSSYSLNLTAINAKDAKFIWGMQPPEFMEPLTLTLVTDTFDPQRGPAWWLGITYDKTVIISEGSFSAKTKRFKLSKHFEGARVAKGSVGAQEGDKPWICTWPNTTLDIFIYPRQNASPTSKIMTSAPPTPTSLPTNSSYLSTADDLQAYPKVVKFLERRVSGLNHKAYCRQVRVINNGQEMVNETNSNGNPIVVEILENTNTWQTEIAHQRNWHVDARGWPPTFIARDIYALTPCGCLSWST